MTRLHVREHGARARRDQFLSMKIFKIPKISTSPHRSLALVDGLPIRSPICSQSLQHTAPRHSLSHLPAMETGLKSPNAFVLGRGIQTYLSSSVAFSNKNSPASCLSFVQCFPMLEAYFTAFSVLNSRNADFLTHTSS